MSVSGRVKWALLRRVYGGSVAARRFGVSVGEGCRILSLEVASEPWLIEIGDRVTVSSSVLFVTHDGSGWLARDSEGRRFRYARIRVGNDVFIGTRVIILPGVSVGDRVIIGAGSVVTKSIPEGVVVAGNPARIIGRYSEARQKMLTNWKRDVVVEDYVQRTLELADECFRADLEYPPSRADE